MNKCSIQQTIPVFIAFFGESAGIQCWEAFVSGVLKSSTQQTVLVFNAFFGESAGVLCKGVLVAGVLAGVLLMERRSVVPCRISASSLSMMQPSSEVASPGVSFDPAITKGQGIK